MKVLRHVCRACANVQFFAVEVLSKPGTNPNVMRNAKCPFCGSAMTVFHTATEIDMEEVTDDPDLNAIQASIARARRRDPDA